MYHLAAAVGVKLVAEEPVRTIRTTIHGTEVVLDAAHRFGKPVLITSTSEVYGKGSRVPFSEDDDVVMGATSYSRWCYAYSKAIDEFMGIAYYKEFGLPVVLVRLFNTVGPAAGRNVRHGAPALRRSGAGGPAAHRLRRRQPDSDAFAMSPTWSARSSRSWQKKASPVACSTSAARDEISINELAERVIELTGSRSRDRAHLRTSRHTAARSTTSSAACRSSTGSGKRSVSGVVHHRPDHSVGHRLSAEQEVCDRRRQVGQAVRCAEQESPHASGNRKPTFRYVIADGADGFLGELELPGRTPRWLVHYPDSEPSDRLTRVHGR